MSREINIRFLFAGGGTGGHLFPALAVAECIRRLMPEADIMFIGTKNKIEGRVVPKAGFKFKSVWIKGFSRKFTLENLLFPVKLVYSVAQCLAINFKFKPDVAIGSGGYVSGPAIWAAAKAGAKVLILEQNSFPGKTTKMLEKVAEEIHVSYEDSKKYFVNKEKVFVTGNPVRENLKLIEKKIALSQLNLSNSKKVLLILGGSLGAGSINKSLSQIVNKLVENNIQVIWQTGKNYIEEYKKYNSENIKVNAFIEDMNLVYSACDLLISRAGATTIAEISELGIPSILIPSPNVAENHQYYNAKSLSDKNAAVLIEDKNIDKELLDSILLLINDDNKLRILNENVLKNRKINSAEVIAKRAIEMAKRKW